MAHSRMLDVDRCLHRAIQADPTTADSIRVCDLAADAADIMRSYTDPVRLNSGARRDFRRMLRAVDTKYTFEAAAASRNFDKPALVLWGENDKIFPREHGRRLAELLPQGEFELMTHSRTFIPEDQPDLLVTAIEDFLAAQARTE